MANDTDIAILALVISLVALFTTLLQLLQQYFATADGYRRCQKSVMAGWAKYTHRKFRLSEFRFETIFVVPDITFVEESSEGSIGATNEDWTRSDMKVNFQSVEWGNGEYKVFREGWEIKTGWSRWLINVFKIKKNKTHSKEKPAAARGDEEQGVTPVTLPQKRKWNAEPRKAALWSVSPAPRGELACWVNLMGEINKLSASKELNEANPLIYLVFHGRQQSWDFIATDVSRPYIAMSLCDLVVLARLLGMKWTAFNPAKGELRAEGTDYFLNSRVILSVGTVMDFRVIRSAENGVQGEAIVEDEESSVPDSEIPWLERLYVPDARVYRMMFGIIPASLDFTFFGKSGLRVGTVDDWDRTVARLTAPRDDIIVDYLAADILPLVAPILRKKGSRILTLPMAYSCRPSWLGLGRVYREFRAQLQKPHNKDLHLSSKVLHNYFSLRNSEHGKLWDGVYSFRQANLRQRNLNVIGFLDKVTEKFEWAQSSFRKLIFENSKIPLRDFYQQLVLSHLVLLTKANDKAREARKRHQVKGNNRALIITPEGKMSFMFEQLDNLCEDMKASFKGLHAENGIIKDAWILMVFQGMCWTRCHRIEQDDLPVPSQYWRSKHEIYIG